MVTTTMPSPTPRAGAPFAVMLRGAFAPTLALGAATVLVLGLTRGLGGAASGALGLLVAVAFFSSGLAIMARVVRDAAPMLFMAAALSVYLGQVIALLLVIAVADRIPGLDDTAVAVTLLVAALGWQGFAMLAWRRARTLVYDEPSGPDAPGGGAGPGTEEPR